MYLTRPFYFLAIAVAIASLFPTQAQAQDPATVATCEAFNAAVAEMEGAFVVSGITAEETTSPPIEDFETPINNNGFFINLQTVPMEVPQLTLPMGTLTIEGSLPAVPFGTINNQFTVLRRGFDGNSAEAIIGPVIGTHTEYSLRPDPSLGRACGFCLTTDFPIDEFVVSYFDGDTLIGQSSGSDYSFFAGPGETITRIDFAGFLVYDLQVAFCPDVVEPELSNQECFASLAEEVGDLADAATDSYDAYALNVASAALQFAAKDRFYEEDGNRLSRRGWGVFNGAAYAICYLEHTGLDGTDELVDRILDKLEAIVDDEIDYAIANGGHSCLIETAEDYAELAEFIDEDLDNPVVAAIAYKLAWAHAYFATY
jgi:hypothetical protein